MVLPAALESRRELGLDWGRWLDRLPRLLDDLLAEWGLTRDGDDLGHRACSLVAPVLAEDGTRAVLKLTFDGDEESLHEGLALQRWHGDGAVRLLRADPHRRALLLERLEQRDLTEMWDLEACEVVAGDVRSGVRRRFYTLVDHAELDEDRARDWVVVRMVLNAGWSVQDARRAGRTLTVEERDWITRYVAITKAVRD